MPGPGKGVLVLTFAVLSIACAVLGYLIFSEHSKELRVTFLDVGSGDAILIEGPTGVKALIDGGPDVSILRALGIELGPFGRTIDAVVETHPGTEATGGIVDVLREYRVRSFLSSGATESGAASDVLDDAISHTPDIKVAALTRGDRINIGDGAYIDILYPDRDLSGVDGDTACLILRVVYGETAFLITGAAPSRVEDYLVQLDGSALKSDVLLAGDRGKKSSTSSNFLTVVAPKYVVISVDANNKYGYPHKETLDRIAATGANVKRTGDGPVRFISDGVAVTVLK